MISTVHTRLQGHCLPGTIARAVLALIARRGLALTSEIDDGLRRKCSVLVWLSRQRRDSSVTLKLHRVYLPESTNSILEINTAVLMYYGTC